MNKTGLLAIICCCVGFACAQGMITYELTGGRFGDQLTSYIHAKWLAYKHNLVLLYKPFVYSNQLVMHDMEKSISQIALDGFKYVPISRHHVTRFGDDRVVYVVPYFPNYPKSALEEQRAMYPIVVDWHDPVFIGLLRTLIVPKERIDLPLLARDRINVALHVRTGGGYDKLLGDKVELCSKVCFSDVCLPLNHPREEFYVCQLKWLKEIFENKKIFVYIFTDDHDPMRLCEYYRLVLNCPTVTFDCRRGRNSEDEHVLEDFFAMQLFDCLICPNSNYSIIASKIGHNAITIFPAKYTWQGTCLVMTHVKVELKLQELQYMVDRQLISMHKLSQLLVA